MTSISMLGAGLSANIAASRTTATTLINTQALVETATPLPSTRLTLSSVASNDFASDAVVYTMPKAADESLLAPTRAWASQAQDDISTLMARNRDRAVAGSLADQWRGLGGALLSRVAATGSGYRQAMVDYVVAPGTERTQAMDALAQSGVQNGATTVSLKIKTRSGQTVELSILVNSGANGGNRGMQVAVTTSGPLSSGERKALADLAEGFDQALEGLGQPGKLKLDLSKMLAYDSSALASVDMAVQNPTAKQALSSFYLQLGADQKTLAFKGKAGEIALNLATDMPLSSAPLTSDQQRQVAIAAHLQQFDAAAQRSHADAALVDLFKDAFTQLHGAPAGQASAEGSALVSPLARQVQPLLSGLADFQASFGGDFEKTNDRGAVNEIGRADYQLSQKTSAVRKNAEGDLAVSQTLAEKLDAHYLKSRTGGMLDTSAGDYDIYKINDSSTSTTSIETANGELGRAVKTTEQHQLTTFEKLIKHHAVEQRRTPLDKRFQQLLH